MNGRFGLDSALATCKDTSVIDYFAISPELFSCTLDMKVKSFNPLFSDVHNTIELHVHPSFLVCVAVTCTVTRQGWMVGPPYRLLLMWAHTLLIATCHVTHYSTNDRNAVC